MPFGRRNPSLLERSYNADRPSADGVVNCYEPGGIAQPAAPSLFAMLALASVGRGKRMRRVAQRPQPDLPEQPPVVLREAPYVGHAP